VISASYPLLDALMVALAAGLVLRGGRRTSAWLLLLWTVLQTAADTVYVSAILDGGFALRGARHRRVDARLHRVSAAALCRRAIASAGTRRRVRRGSLLAAAGLRRRDPALPVLLVVRAVQGSCRTSSSSPAARRS
jgi:hypothetical protein